MVINLKIITIVGARPQFIKAAPVSREIRKFHNEILVHTGQHYDDNMSKIFFDELNIPKPDYNLNIGSGTHGVQTGRMLIEIEKILFDIKPDMVIVYGDTNSTIAGALAASKLLIPVIHIEAGLRSYNMDMPEEQNRVLTDHISKYLFCPTDTAIKNLEKEGITKDVYNTGDVMYDAFLYNKYLIASKKGILKKLNIQKKGYLLATVHRAENTDNILNMRHIINAFNDCGKTIVFPIHPRTKKFIDKYNLRLNNNIIPIDPVGYLEMVELECNAVKIITDSGGVQKEAYFAKIPCITLRNETEWVETVEAGWNILSGTDKDKITNAIMYFNPVNEQKNYFGNGRASSNLVKIINNI